MRRLLYCIVGIVFALTAPPPATAEDGPVVDVQLVLAIDSSSSVNMDEFYLQLGGYAAAFRNPELLKAIRSGPHRAIAVILVEWSGSEQQVVNLPWRILRDEASLTSFAEELELAPRLVIGGETAIGAAIDFSVRLFDSSGATGGRRVIDVSGDGVNNRGRDVGAARNDATFLGVTINGVAIQNEEPNLETYYRAFVIGGTGAFAMAAQDYRDFQDVILKKLVREITTIADAGAPAR